MTLPETFIKEMTDLFDRFDRVCEVPDFLASFQEKPNGGLRANSLKIGAHDLRRLLARTCAISTDQLQPVSWSDDGFYYTADLQPGRLALHAAGLYYIQEPSAMLPAMVLDARPGERVLDLCAAPGGKACKIAACLDGRGLLWANEISSSRVKALLHNIEQTGCVNAVITQETPERLADALTGFFDKVLVDAPCSGQGMFRRDPAAIGSWLDYGSQHCAGLQRGILRSAWQMLRPGGRLVYSTCTFSLLENEEMILWMLDEFPDCRLEPIKKLPGISDGLPLTPELAGTARIWPHLSKGEGHFCALLRKLPDESAPELQSPAGQTFAERMLPAADQPAWEAFDAFCRENLTENGLDKIRHLIAAGYSRLENQALHILPDGFSVPRHFRKIKAGLYLGQVRPIREGRLLFEPSQSFLLSLDEADLRFRAAGTAGSDLISRYLRGETLKSPDSLTVEKGRFTAVLLEGLPYGCGNRQAWPLGWAKAQEGDLLKNLYPKAWRFFS